jgi:hypothetical protein
VHHVGFYALLSLGADAIQNAGNAPKLKRAAQLVLPPLRAIDAVHSDELPDGDPYNDLYHALDQLLPRSSSTANQNIRRTRDFLALLTAAAATTEPDTVARAARDLFADPVATACVLASSDDNRRTEQRLRTRILMAAASIDPALAGRFAADLPGLRSNDPRDEPALRNEINTCWRRLLHTLQDQPEFPAGWQQCPEPGASLLKKATAPGGADGPTTLYQLTTAQAAIGVTQAISATSLALSDPIFPTEALH